eukprot:7898344-Karenia_brevis.AAC.1
MNPAGIPSRKFEGARARAEKQVGRFCAKANGLPNQSAMELETATSVYFSETLSFATPPGWCQREMGALLLCSGCRGE